MLDEVTHAQLGFEVNHAYGSLTYGPITICEWNPARDELDVEQRAHLKARQASTW